MTKDAAQRSIQTFYEAVKPAREKTMCQGKVAVVVNPHAGGGSAGKEWKTIERSLLRRLKKFDFTLTRGPGDATRMTREHLRSGADMIVCVGGDGTFNEVINGFIENDNLYRKGSTLAFIPNGTGCDFRRTAGIAAGLDESVEAIIDGQVEEIDIGKLDFIGADGNRRQRYFHNIASFGLGGEVDARVNRTSKLLGPFLSFIRATLVSVFLYGKKRIRLRVDDHFDSEVVIWNVAVANGRYHGGGMYVAPEAKLTDGLFHVVIIGDMTLPQIFRHLPKLYNGKINRMSAVTTLVGRKIRATSDELTLLDVDGEQPGRLPATLEIIPGILPLVVGRKA